MKKSDRILILREQISIMKDKMAEKNSVFDSMRNRMFVLLGIEISLAGVLASPLVSIPYPSTVAGSIFLYIAIGFIALSVSVLLFSYRTTRDWPSAMGEAEVKMMNMSEDEEAALKILYADYRLSFNQAASIISPSARALNASLIMFVVGAIILIVLKFGG